MPLYLANTNRIESLGGGVSRGPAASLISSSVSASYTTNSSSLFVLLNDATTKLSTTASATTNFLAAPNSVVSASLSATTPSSTVSMSLFISASDASYYFTGSSTGSSVMTSFTVGNNVIYTISSSFNRLAPTNPTGIGLYRTLYNGYFYDNPMFYVTSSVISSSADLSPLTASLATATTIATAQWLGYFTPRTSETYSFALTSDDGSYLWLGNAATASTVTTSSALVENGGIRAVQTITGSIGLVSGSYYPIRIQYGNAQSVAIFTASLSTPTISSTTNWSGSIYYNTASNGF